MGIKHMPSGLFPHFDSGLERRPYFVRWGETVEIGCRLDGKSQTAEVSMELRGNAGIRIEKGILSSSNDRNQKYFKFRPNIEGYKGTVSYKFISSDGETSKTYYFSILQDTTLTVSSIIYKDEYTGIIYLSDDIACQMRVYNENPVRVTFISYLTDKVSMDKFLYHEPPLEDGYIRVFGRGSRALYMAKNLRLLQDEKHNAYEISFEMRFPGEAIFGMGEKFDRVNQAGMTPLNYVVEQYAHQMDKTYLPVPFFFSDAGVGFYQQGTYRSQFDLSKEGYIGSRLVTVTSRCPKEGCLFEGFIFEGSPGQMIKAYTDRTGKPALPPSWALGPWMSSNGWNTQREAMEQIQQMNRLSIPASVMVLEAWSDEETFYIWNDAVYKPKDDGSPFTYGDFSFKKEGKWPDPKGFVQALSDNNVHLVLWQIPVIKYEAAPHGKQLDYDESYAIKHGLCIKNEDSSPYRITEMWFGNSLMPDFTNPDTCRWWFEKRRYLVEELGVTGFKTDGGEFLFDLDSYLKDGRSIEEGHNAFPDLYEEAYYSFMNRTMGEGKGVLFSRAGYSGCQRYPIHWAGDQVSEFSELKGQLTAGLSAGLSGIPFWGFDIGGFAGPFPTTELFLRSAAMAAFAPIMQFHSEPRYGQYYMTERQHWNNDRSPWNMAVANNDDSIIEIYRLFANLRMSLMPYICQEAEYSSNTSRPLMAHLVYDYLICEGDRVLNIEDEYMFGRSLLVAPIIEEGRLERQVYLPKGIWYDFWTGERMAGGYTTTCRCDLARIPVFVKEDTLLPVNFNKNRCMGTSSIACSMANDTERFENLGFLLYGREGDISYQDMQGRRISVRIHEGLWKAFGDRKLVEVYDMTEGGVTAGDIVEAVSADIFGRRITGSKLTLTGREDHEK